MTQNVVEPCESVVPKSVSADELPWDYQSDEVLESYLDA